MQKFGVVAAVAAACLSRTNCAAISAFSTFIKIYTFVINNLCSFWHISCIAILSAQFVLFFFFVFSRNGICLENYYGLGTGRTGPDQFRFNWHKSIIISVFIFVIH